MKQALLSLLLLASLSGYGQYQDHIWYFGNSTAGLSFNASNIPSGLNNKYTPFGAEGCFVATNPTTGELMFYTSGNTIINKNHVPMQNGTLVFPAPAPIPQPANGPFNSSVNGAQSVAVIEKPNAVANGDCGKYFYFINDANEWGGSGKPGSLYIGEIDMNANSGLGSVTQQPVRRKTNAFTESMLAIVRPDNQGAWIILSNILTNSLEVYAVTDTGVNMTPVSSFVIPGVNWPATWGTQNAAQYAQLIGSMAYNQPTGKFALAQSYGNRYELYIGDFNSATGALSGVTLRETFTTPGTFIAYGTEFSPSGNWLYNSIAAQAAGAGAVRAYNMQTSTDIGNINGAGGWAGLMYNGLKAGPDGRLWVNTNNYGSDGIPARVVRSTFNIENPVALGFVSFALPVNTFSYRFPDFLSLVPPPFAVDDQEVIINCTDTTVTTSVLNNDSSSANLFVDHIVDTPLHGTIQLTGNQVSYTLSDLSFVGTDTVSYLVRSNVSCLSPGKVSRLLVHVTQCPRDYGDAPNSYQTSIASNGAAHNVVAGLHLGPLAPDVDTNGLISANASGDNSVGTNDEDGVASFPVIAGGSAMTITNYAVTVSVSNTSGASASLCGWIDWNVDGQFDSSESISTIVPDGGTSAALTWPSATLSGPSGSAGTFARFRISTDTVRSRFPNGVVEDGEVEDYYVAFTTPLPLTLASFEARKTGTTALLTWETTNEQHITHFNAERSSDGTLWNLIDRMEAAGTSTTGRRYELTDVHPLKGNNYYRLAVVATDGSSKLGPVRSLSFGSDAGAVTVVPNPAHSTAAVLFGIPAKEELTLKLLNSFGQLVATHTVPNGSSSYLLSLEKLARGVYYLNIEGATEQVHLRLIVQ